MIKKGFPRALPRVSTKAVLIVFSFLLLALAPRVVYGQG
jgi:hypothetical protein